MDEGAHEVQGHAEVDARLLGRAHQLGVGARLLPVVQDAGHPGVEGVDAVGGGEGLGRAAHGQRVGEPPRAVGETVGEVGLQPLHGAGLGAGQGRGRLEQGLEARGVGRGAHDSPPWPPTDSPVTASQP